MKSQIKRSGFLVVLVILLVTASSPLQAASIIQPISRLEQNCGISRCVTLSGKVSLSKGESVSDVRVIVNDANGRPLSEAAGTYMAATNSWTVSIGDYQLASYYATITIKRNGRVTMVLRTSTYYWRVR